MYEQDTLAEFVGGPLDGELRMLPGKPYSYTVAQAPDVTLTPTANIEWPKIVHHVYHRNDTRFMDGGTIAYEYTGEST